MDAADLRGVQLSKSSTDSYREQLAIDNRC
jgi:hypothetical protein